jgi:hypothetical protein
MLFMGAFFFMVVVLSGPCQNYPTFFFLRALYGIDWGGFQGVAASLTLESAPGQYISKNRVDCRYGGGVTFPQHSASTLGNCTARHRRRIFSLPARPQNLAVGVKRDVIRPEGRLNYFHES